MSEYVSPLRSLLSNNFFFLLLPTTVSFQLITSLLTGSWQFVIFLPTKSLLPQHDCFPAQADGDTTQRIQHLPCAIHAKILLPRSGPHPKQIVLVGHLQTQPLLSPLPSPGPFKDH